MTKLRILAVLMIAILAVALVGCGEADKATIDNATETSTEAAFAVGDTVAAEWSDGKLYLADVTAVDDDGTITVTYLDDDSEGVLDESTVFAIEDKEWEVGERVLAVWAIARFYSGTIESVEGEDYIVAWDDGSDSSIVRPTEIVEYNAKYADDAE